MMPLFGLQGSVTFPAQTAYTPPKTNWASIESSSATDNASSYSLMNAQGSFNVPTTGLYTILFNFNRNELNYNDTAIISVNYTPVTGNAYTLGSSTTAAFQHTMTFNAGDQLTPVYKFNSACTSTLSSASVTNTFRVILTDPTHLYMYQASTSALPLSNPAPRMLCFTASLTSGFQVVIPLTIDNTTTGAAIFNTITGVTATAVASTATTNVMNTLLTSIDPIPSNLKTITVNVASGTTITTLVVGSNYTVKAAPTGTIVYLTVFGW